MNCPYCLSEVDEEAVVCKACTRDLYLFKPMMARVAELEKQLEEIGNQTNYQERILELEDRLEGYEQKKYLDRGIKETCLDVLVYLIVQLLILLAAHDVITVVYDTKMVYLRVISIIVPLPFGYFLFKQMKRPLLPWFIGVILLAIASVIGMSWITSLVDNSPVLPQTTFEWREVLEYAASIAFSFLTGMLLGGMSYANNHQAKLMRINPLVRMVLSALGDDKLTPEALHKLMKKINEYGGTIVALGTTALSIYAGLKHVF